MNTLPIEILQHIFKDLSGCDLLTCRGICTRWQQAIDELNDKYWKVICAEEFSYIPEDSHTDMYEQAYRKANLSWRQLFMTLSLWPEVQTAEFRVLQLPYTNVVKFQLLADGIIGVPCNDCDPNTHQYNTIVYHDLNTMQERSRRSIDTPFTDYAENDKLILIKNLEKYIDVTMKANNKRYSFKKHEDSKFLWALFDNEFYYHTLGKLYCVKLIEQNGEACLDSVEITGNTNLDYSEEISNIEDITYMNNEEVNVRTGFLEIYSKMNNEMSLVSYCVDQKNVLDTLRMFGFRWSANDISQHLRMEVYYADRPVKRSDFSTEVDAVCMFNEVVIIATPAPHRKLLIYYKPYNHNTELTLYEADPDISVDLDAFDIGDAQHKPSVTQIDVVEAVNGHNIIVLCCGVVYVIDLNHDGRRSEPVFESKNVTYEMPKKSKLKKNKKSLSKCNIQ